MRSYLTDLLRFTLFAVPVYIAFIILAGILSPFSEHRNIKYARGGYGHLLTRLQEADTTGPVDILFLGSSHAYRGFDPRVFNAVGFRTFNLGSSSQSPVQTRWLVDRYLERMKPKLVVMDVFPTTFTTEGIESTLNVLSNAPLDPALLRMALRTAHADACNTAILALWHELTNTHPVSSEPAWQPRDQDRYIPGGYVEKAQIPFAPPRNASKLDWDPPVQQWSAFLYIMEQLRAHNIPVILVQTPVTRSWQYTMEERAELRQRLEPHANAYLDLSDALNGDDALLFYDGHHMRQASVERFNTMFLDSLAARNLLPGH
jgi:hypothetical protein